MSDSDDWHAGGPVDPAASPSGTNKFKSFPATGSTQDVALNV